MVTRLVYGALLALAILLAGGAAMAQEETKAQSGPAVSIKFIYMSCNDLEAMRAFYSELLGMQESSYRNDEEYAWLVYNCGSFQFMVFPAGYQLPVLDDWGMQPGWAGGTLEVTSWSIEVPEASYAETVTRLSAAGLPTYADQPQWCQDSYWSFPVRDPMGNTVEVYMQPAERPQSTDWPTEPEDSDLA